LWSQGCSLEELEPLTNNTLYVLPQYVEKYKAQAKAEQISDEITVHPMPDEFLYCYDN